MVKYIALAGFLILGRLAFTQTNTFSKTADSDPAAKALLDKVRKKYEGYSSLEVQFALEIELPNKPKETQTGSFAQQAKKYRLKMPEQSVICNGEALWLILDRNKEVQINPMPEEAEDDAIFTPQALFKIYDRGDYAYIMTADGKARGKTVKQIEFKPLKRTDDYSKLRLSIDKTTNEIVEMLALGKDGSRFVFAVTQATANKVFAPDYFSFDVKQFPGYHVEDLR